MFDTGYVNANTQFFISYAVPAADNQFLTGITGTGTVIIYSTTGLDTGYPAPIDGTWKHLVRTSNRTTGAEILYLNGVQVFSTTLNAGTLYTTGGSLVLGHDQDNVGGGFSAAQNFKGKIGQVKIYDAILSAEQVAQNFNQTRGRFGV